MQTLNDDEKIALAAMVMSVLDGWGLTAGQQIILLQLPEDTKNRSLRKYRENTPLPDSEDIQKRIEHILGISSALRTTYPTNAQMSGIWLNQLHRRLGTRTPLQIILQDGIDGLITIRAHLDCTFAWSLAQ